MHGSRQMAKTCAITYFRVQDFRINLPLAFTDQQSFCKPAQHHIFLCFGSPSQTVSHLICRVPVTRYLQYSVLLNLKANTFFHIFPHVILFLGWVVFKYSPVLPFSKFTFAMIPTGYPVLGYYNYSYLGCMVLFMLALCHLSACVHPKV